MTGTQERKSMLMISCEQASRLLSERLDRTLTRRERLALGMHLAMCRACLRFRRQVGFLHRACRVAGGQDPE